MRLSANACSMRSHRRAGASQPQKFARDVERIITSARTLYARTNHRLEFIKRQRPTAPCIVNSHDQFVIGGLFHMTHITTVGAPNSTREESQREAPSRRGSLE